MLNPWTSRAAAPFGVTLAVVAAAAVLLRVDLSPTVEGDFFFAENDPQMRASREVERRFPMEDQLILRVTDRGSGEAVAPADTAYRARVAALTRDLLAVEGVEGGFSIATNDPSVSPLFRRVLLTPDPAATNVVLQVDGTDPELLLPRVEEVVARHEGPELDIVVSGVPAIVELIRRSLFRDLVVFSTAAVIVFALLMGAVYRDAAIVVGTLATCFVAVAATLLTVQAVDVGIGLLTANLVTIVFVLTLSHVVFMTGNWLRAVAEPGLAGDRARVLGRAVRDTAEGSLWSMATTLLGFASLLIATARPLRELGVAGVVGTAAALVVAYLVYPAFLGRWARATRWAAPNPPDATAREAGPADEDPSGVDPSGRADPGRLDDPAAGQDGAGPIGAGRWVLPTAAVVVGLMALGIPRIDTDPGLLTYFEEGSELREGLSRIDADGGSSTLDIVVADPGGDSISSPSVFARLGGLQATLESDSAVGVVLSPAVLIEHARTVPLAGFLPVPMLLTIASSEAMEGVGLGFVTPDRSHARFALRMRETVDEPRDAVMERLRADVRREGLEPVVIAGLYDLQAQLGRLIASSLRVGIGGLLALFLLIAAIVSRSPWVTASMWICLASIPAVTLGAFGHLGVALDLITSPAANIALAVGADSMIHLVVRVRRLRTAGHATPWAEGLSQIGPPVLAATAIVCAGFGIFALSSFPPTQRFGFAVIVGTLTAGAMALVVLPRAALVRERAT